MAPVVTGPKRTNKKGGQGQYTFVLDEGGVIASLVDSISLQKLINDHLVFNQNPVFSVIADDGTSTPGKERQSPSHGKF